MNERFATTELVELEVNLNALDPTLNVAGGVGVDSGFLIKKHPIKSPTESVFRFCAITCA